LEKSGCQSHAYVIMVNHLHFLIPPPSKQRTTCYIYAEQWQIISMLPAISQAQSGKGILVSSIYLRFINILKCPPIKAGIVTTLNDYLWSSYLPNALGVGDELTTSHNLYLSLGNDVESRCVKYQALFDGLDLIK
jgi:putative transposase